MPDMCAPRPENARSFRQKGIRIRTQNRHQADEQIARLPVTEGPSACLPPQLRKTHGQRSQRPERLRNLHPKGGTKPAAHKQTRKSGRLRKRGGSKKQRRAPRSGSTTDGRAGTDFVEDSEAKTASTAATNPSRMHAIPERAHRDEDEAFSCTLAARARRAAARRHTRLRARSRNRSLPRQRQACVRGDGAKGDPAQRVLSA